MAYMTQEKKAELAPGIKAVLKKYGVKGTLSVRHHSTLVVNLSSGKLDIIGDYIENNRANFNPDAANVQYLQVNHYWIAERYSGKVKEFLLALKDAMMKGNHDRSDIQSDYFDVGWYININAGTWDKPYIFTK